MQIEITEQDIAGCSPRNAHECPVARAFKRTGVLAHPAVKSYEILDASRQPVTKFAVPARDMVDFIGHVDRGGRVEPCILHYEMPA
jgi:hypothetical protein